MLALAFHPMSGSIWIVQQEGVAATFGLNSSSSSSLSSMSSAAAIWFEHLENLRKRRHVDYMPWASDLRDRVLVGNSSCPLESPETASDLS